MEEARRYLEDNQQGHLLKHLDRLGPEQQQRLLEHIEEVDVKYANQVYENAMRGLSEAKSRKIEPLPAERVVSGTAAERAAWREAGLARIAAGEVAVLLLAGGQGTRLGSAEPKGMFDIALPSGKSLFQLQAERLRHLASLASARAGHPVAIPWYIMTSDVTYEATRAFFEAHSYWGLAPGDVFFFNQGMVPCMTLAGGMMMQDAELIALSPNGNGGLYRGLSRSKSSYHSDRSALEDMSARGIKIVHQYCVDNALVAMADPVFVGFFAEKGADVGAKVVAKTFLNEAIGQICLRDGRPDVVEYSEISAELRQRLWDMQYKAGHICINMFSVEFFQRIVRDHLDSLPYHVAKKAIPNLDDPAPKEPNGYKFELFIFDTFQFAQNFVALEVERNDEFAPLKNASGAAADTPETCRALLSAYHTKLLEAAGATVVPGDGILELSTDLTAWGEGLEAAKGKTFTRGHITSL